MRLLTWLHNLLRRGEVPRMSVNPYPDSNINPRAFMWEIYHENISFTTDARDYQFPAAKYLQSRGLLVEEYSKIEDQIGKTDPERDDEQDMLERMFGAGDEATSYYLYRDNLVVVKLKSEKTVDFDFYYPASKPCVVDEFKQWVIQKVGESRVSILVTQHGSLVASKVSFTPPVISDLELNYGTGFAATHAKILKKLNERKAALFLMHGDPGSGKCLGKDTPVFMFDGTIKKVQEVVQGDLVMGPDSSPRMVMGTTTGVEELYRIVPVKGTPFIANRSHVLSLRLSGEDSDYIHNISINDYLNLSEGRQERFKLWRTGLHFAERVIPLDPYFLGLWLGDGHSAHPSITTMDSEIVEYLHAFASSIGNEIYLHRIDTKGKQGKASTWGLYGRRGRYPGGAYPENHIKAILSDLSILDNKHIPEIYRVNSRQVRLQVLAGLIDSDGYVNRSGVEITLKSRQLAEDIGYLARSLGYAAYLREVTKCCSSKGKQVCGQYWKTSISGDLEEIPTKIGRKRLSKRRQIKRTSVTGFSVESVGAGDYYGFQVDQDGLFCLGDLTVTHNSTYIKHLTSIVDREFIFIPVNMTDQLASPDFISLLMNKKQAVLILEDAEKAVQERGGTGNDSAVATLLNLADGILGSLLSISIIVTYNADRQFIDKALMRKGRLSFDYDFGPLKKADAARLMKYLGKDAPVDGPMTLADIYGVEDYTGHTPAVPKQVGFGALLSSQVAKQAD